MKKRIERWLLRHWRWYRNAKLYVIADATDNSVTFSKALFRLLDVMDKEVAPKVYVFRLCNAATEPAADAAGTVTGSNAKGAWSGTLYAFCINPIIEQETQLADIQYNAKHFCVGFECLVPTVNRIFYDYGLKAETRAKLTVLPATTNGMEYYIIMPPKVR